MAFFKAPLIRRNLLIVNGASGRTRTCNLLIRSQKLYPIELRMRVWTATGKIARPEKLNLVRPRR